MMVSVSSFGPEDRGVRIPARAYGVTRNLYIAMLLLVTQYVHTYELSL
jgi:hypothetical protein